MNSLKIGICGVGNVGGAVLDTLEKNPEIIQSQGGVKLDVEIVGARKGKSAVTNKNLNVVSHEVAEKTCEEAANYPVDTAKQFLSQIRLILDKEEPEYVN